MNAKVTVTKDSVARLLKAVQEVASKDVLVGIPGSTNERKEQSPKQPLNNATIAFIQEKGSALHNLPPRPFLAVGIAGAKDQIAGRLSQSASAALEGSVEKAEQGLHAAGLEAQNAVRAKINSGPFAPLAPSTLAARRRRGRTGTKPLIDTAQLRNSITYVIREK